MKKYQIVMILFLSLICTSYFVNGDIHQTGFLALDKIEKESEDSQKLSSTIDTVSETEFDPEQWTEINTTAAIPKGSHIRIDMNTGKRFIKIEESLKVTRAQEMERVLLSLPNPDPSLYKLAKLRSEITPEEYEAGLQKIWNKRQVELQAAMDAMENTIKEMQNLLNTVLSKNGTSHDKVHALNHLESYVQDLDHAHDFYHMGGLEVCSLLVADPNLDPDVKAMAAYTLGSAVKSNLELQTVVHEMGAERHLLRALETGRGKSNLGKKAMYALGAVLRGNLDAQNEVAAKIGPVLLKVLGEDDASDSVLLKTVGMVQFHATETICHTELNPYGSGDDRIVLKVKDGEIDGVGSACVDSPLRAVFSTKAWCDAISGLFARLNSENKSLSVKNKVLEAGRTLVDQELCPVKSFLPAKPALLNLQTELKQHCAVHREDNEFEAAVLKRVEIFLKIIVS